MPHIILEYTANTLEKDRISEVFPLLHSSLVTNLPAKIEHCKSRAIKIDDYLSGLDRSEFVIATIIIKKGREDKIIDAAAQEIMAILTKFFAESINKLELKICFEIKILSDYYYSN